MKVREDIVYEKAKKSIPQVRSPGKGKLLTRLFSTDYLADETFKPAAPSESALIFPATLNWGDIVNALNVF